MDSDGRDNTISREALRSWYDIGMVTGLWHADRESVKGHSHCFMEKVHTIMSLSSFQDCQ